MTAFRCVLEASAGGAVYVNVWHLNAPTGSSAAIGAGFHSQVTNAYATALHSSVTLDQIVVTEINTHQQATTLINTAGTQTGDMLPPQVAAVISWKTAYIGKQQRGRTYVFGQAESAQAAGIWNGTQLGILATLASKIRVDWPATVGGQLVVYHRNSQSINDVTQYIVRDVAYTQRRRTIGVGA